MVNRWNTIKIVCTFYFSTSFAFAATLHYVFAPCPPGQLVSVHTSASAFWGRREGTLKWLSCRIYGCNLVVGGRCDSYLYVSSAARCAESGTAVAARGADCGAQTGSPRVWREREMMMIIIIIAITIVILISLRGLPGDVPGTCGKLAVPWVKISGGIHLPAASPELAGWPASWPAGQMAGLLASWPAGRPAGRLDGQLAGWRSAAGPKNHSFF